MNTHIKRALSLMLCATLVIGFLLVKLPEVKAAHYTGYSTVAVVYNQGDCYAMQGCDSDDNYIYCTKVNTETETSGVLGYSIGACCSSQASKATAISNLAMATAVYGYQAKQYFG